MERYDLFHRKSTHLIPAAAALSILYGCSGEHIQSGPVIAPEDYVSSASSPSIQVHDGVLVFDSTETLTFTLNSLSMMTSEERRSWNEEHGVRSLQQIFDEVVEAESSLMDDYERMSEEELRILLGSPAEPVHSEVYNEALERGHIRLVSDPDGAYFDFNVREAHLAPVLDQDGIVVVGDVALQYQLPGVKILRGYQPGVLVEFRDAPPSSALVDYASYMDGEATKSFYTYNWTTYSKPGNDWHVVGKRRYRAWIDGVSSVGSSDRMYVTNQLRVQGQKKNIFGSWDFRETYATQIAASWDWYYRMDGWILRNLSSGSMDSPLMYTSNYINNAYLPLHPHTSGYYQFDGYDCGDLGLCGIPDPVGVDCLNVTVRINGNLLTVSRESLSNEVPTLSGASSSVTRSGVYSSSYEAWKAFDSSNSTYWISETWEAPAWIAYDFGALRHVTEYRITFANGPSLATRAPRDWQLQGWNGSSWVTVDSRSGQTGWGGIETRTFPVSNPGLYSRYRLQVTRDNDSRSDIVVVSIARLQLMGATCP